ncbi:DNA alkylation repair protein [Bacillus haynesii]|uniref:DNA alkylation repair protein n=1 Tax=Bacillus haynesii TaxID=1925021 RepID=UPI0015F75F08|nr:DNA alkylation repair protein [Bacillus haynesii]MCY7835737.1 DNA alkylation repair protein [Bacillus haynesii]MCY8400422.1 DNA alkylation repair protein [Bacillus haynesii]
MTAPYLCPNCKTNRTRFNLIEQSPTSVKIAPATGEIMETYSDDELSPFHLPYSGPAIKVQCGACGLIEDEKTFIKLAEFDKRT